MRIASFLLVLSTLMMAMCALLCGCSEAPQVSDVRLPIIGGTVDNGDPAVVLLYAQVPGAQGGSICTAELISPHVVLTAAHCVRPQEVGQGAVFRVFVGTDFTAARAADLLPVKSVHFDPLFNVDNLDAGHDIGVAILQNPAPVAPLAINRTPLDASFVGKPVRFVGYGVTNGTTGVGSGLKRQVSTTLTSFNNLLIHFSDGTKQTCSGDSGGPAFMTVNGKEVIVGLTSFGDVACVEGGYDTRVDSFLSFVDQYLQLNDPTPDMATVPDLATPPDLSQRPDLRPQPEPEPEPEPRPNPDPPSRPSTPPSTTTTPASTAKLQVGEACKRDDECASSLCGLGNQGTYVCFPASAQQSSATMLGGCATAGGGADETALGLLLVGGALLRRGLRRQRRDRDEQDPEPR